MLSILYSDVDACFHKKNICGKFNDPEPFINKSKLRCEIQEHNYRSYFDGPIALKLFLHRYVLDFQDFKNHP